MAMNCDRISNLTDPILQFIISLVPLKSAIRTSILSRRWRHPWKYNLSSANSLEFGKEFASRQSPDEFVATVDRYLQLHDSKKLERLCILFFPFDIYFPNLERWIAFAAMKKVEQLDLDLLDEYKVSLDLRIKTVFPEKRRRKPIKLPRTLFDCVSLVRLSLSCCKFCSPVEFKRFGDLRSLCLKDVSITDDALHSVLADCTVLQSLSLRNCHHLQSIRIVGCKLRLERFKLVECHGVYSLEISAPTLKSLHQFGRIHYRHEFTNVSSLVDAFVSYVGREPFGSYTKMLSDLAHVKILTLCTATLWHVARDGERNTEPFLVQLQNLQELQLLIDNVIEESLSYIFTFFQLCPSPILEKLFILLPKYLEDHSEIGPEFLIFDSSKKQPDVIFNNLKVIKVSNFRGGKFEIRLLKFLLEKAVTLQTIVIVAPPVDAKNGADVEYTGSSSQCKPSELLRLKVLHGQLSRLPKASPDVHIVICDYLEDNTGISPQHTTEVYCEHSFYSSVCEPSVADYFSD